MATRTVESCDLCHEDIREGARRIRLSAQRWDEANVIGEFKMATFCGERCALAAVRALCNGHG